MEGAAISEEVLMAVSQIAIALIGFSGIVTALGHGQGQKWTASELLQLRTQVEPSMCALFGGLVPSTVGLLVTSPEMLWRISNLVLVGFIIAALTAHLYRSRRAPTLWSQRFLSIVSVVVIVVMILAASNIVIQREFVFMLGLWLALIVGVHNFTLLLFRIERGDA
jgi:hypothetical protein